MVESYELYSSNTENVLNHFLNRLRFKYYLSHSKNQVETCKIFGCSERCLMRWVDKYKSANNITRKKRDYRGPI